MSSKRRLIVPVLAALLIILAAVAGRVPWSDPEWAIRGWAA
jgi:hypothetical protein